MQATITSYKSRKLDNTLLLLASLGCWATGNFGPYQRCHLVSCSPLYLTQHHKINPHCSCLPGPLPCRIVASQFMHVFLAKLPPPLPNLVAYRVPPSRPPVVATRSTSTALLFPSSLLAKSRHFNTRFCFLNIHRRYCQI